MRWQLRDISPGKYDVSLRHACEQGQAGTSYRVTFGDQQSLEGTVTDSGGWEQMAMRKLGTVEIGSGEKPIDVTLEPLEKQHSWVMNFSELVLSPRRK